MTSRPMGIDPVYSMDSNACEKDIIPISYQIFFQLLLSYTYYLHILPITEINIYLEWCFRPPAVYKYNISL